MNKEEKQIGKIWDVVWSKFDLENFTDVDKISDLWTTFHLDLLKREISTLAPGSLFLEAGCGLGQWCFYAHKMGHHAVGVDIAPEVIEKLNNFIKEKDEFRDIQFIVDDLTRSKMQNSQFDYIVSLGVIEHFRDSMPMLRELHRLLKAGGRIFVSVPNIFSVHTVTRPLTKLLGIWKIGFEKSYSLWGLARQMRKAGFCVCRAGIIPSGQLFGRVLNSVPVFGRLFKKAGYFIESRQDIFGIYLYAVGQKKPLSEKCT